jgi:MoxR-like ATPase
MTTTNQPTSPFEKIQAVRAAMRATYIEREDAIECLLLGAIAQQHVLFLGPPGTGKSHLVTALTSCITGCDTFVTLLTKYTTEDELCGPAKLSALKQDRFERATVGHLPAAHVAFLDEVFKANAACLNATLSIANERLYKGAPCPLRFMAGASNELPQDESLGAMYDRFLLRHVVAYVSAESEWIRMLASEPKFQAPCQLSLAELDAITTDARKVKIGRPVLEALAKMKDTLGGRGVIASDRRWIQLLGVLRAAAWLEGAAEVEIDHLSVLRFGLWQQPDQAPVVTAVLAALPAGPARQAIQIIDEALRLVAQRPTDPDALFDAAPRLVNACKEAARKVKALEPKLTKASALRVNAAMDQLRKAHETVQTELKKRMEANASL